MVAVASGDAVPDPGDADRMALSCYARAMDHVGVMSDDPVFRWVDRVILDLHFDACYFQKDKDPGRYRTRGIEVTNPGGGPPAYVGPPRRTSRSSWSRSWRGSSAVTWTPMWPYGPRWRTSTSSPCIRSATATGASRGSSSHWSLLARACSRRSSSRSRSTSAATPRRTTRPCKTYRAGRISPSATPVPGWTSACGHTSTRLAGDSISSRRPALAGPRSRISWSGAGWPDRLVIALEQSIFSGVDRASYIAEADVSAPTASNDLRRLLDAGLVVQRGKGRNTRYVASDALRADLQRRHS